MKVPWGGATAVSEMCQEPKVEPASPMQADVSPAEYDTEGKSGPHGPHPKCEQAVEQPGGQSPGPRGWSTPPQLRQGTGSQYMKLRIPQAPTSALSYSPGRSAGSPTLTSKLPFCAPVATLPSESTWNRAGSETELEGWVSMFAWAPRAGQRTAVKPGPTTEPVAGLC